MVCCLLNITKEKPKILYHGSPHRDIEKLEPRDIKKRDPEEGPQVFATHDLATATIFMAEQANGPSGLMNDIPYFIILDSRDNFIKNDRGGHVYILPSENFTSDPNKGLGEYEWTSKTPIKPIDKIEYPSVLDAMIENGVQVYFINKDEFNKIEAEDRDAFIFRNRESENQRRKSNARELK